MEWRDERMQAAGERLRLVVETDGAAGIGRVVAPRPAAAAPPGEAGERIVPHVSGLYACVRALVGNTHVVEDIVHETVAQALGSWRRYDPTRDLGAWLRGIAVNVTRRFWRKTRRGLVATGTIAQMARGCPGGGPNPEADASGREQAELLLAAMEALSPALREAFVLRVVEGLPAAEVARITHTSTAAVHTRVCKARGQLQTAIAVERRRCGKGRSDDDA